MNAALHRTLCAMQAEFESQRLEIVLVPAPSPRHACHMVRVRASINPRWYRDLCAAFPSSRKRNRSLIDTRIRRAHIARALTQMIAGKPADTLNRERILNAARTYWKTNRKKLTA